MQGSARVSLASGTRIHELPSAFELALPSASELHAMIQSLSESVFSSALSFVSESIGSDLLLSDPHIPTFSYHNSRFSFCRDFLLVVAVQPRLAFHPSLQDVRRLCLVRFAKFALCVDRWRTRVLCAVLAPGSKVEFLTAELGGFFPPFSVVMFERVRLCVFASLYWGLPLCVSCQLLQVFEMSCQGAMFYSDGLGTSASCCGSGFWFGLLVQLTSCFVLSWFTSLRHVVGCCSCCAVW